LLDDVEILVDVEIEPLQSEDGIVSVTVFQFDNFLVWKGGKARLAGGRAKEIDPPVHQPRI
jgi:hypothetical protein